MGKTVSVGVVFTSESRGGNAELPLTLNPFDFGSAYKERSNSFSPLLSIPTPTDVGMMYQISKTTLLK